MPSIRLVGVALFVLQLSSSSPTNRTELLAGDGGSRPQVQMLIPGFTVRELPVELPNVNNLRYRPDGKLYALCYNGDIWLLNDADGDGVADSKSRFFDSKGRLRGPIGMAVVPSGHALLAEATHGVVVASKGKVSAILDLDGDDIAETERIIAAGWEEIPQNVDAIGVAIHPDDGSIYFGLGTAAYNNAYLLDADGKSAFDLQSERGTIQRIEPDLSRRETVCTGVRFTIGLAFDEHGELFATDQEGATWLPNGNPFDELLHIQRDLHYGFPPRHPKHLPGVFDEPSVFDYGPQHQSTCGMAFNLPLYSDGRIFGPEEWRGDVFVCGESRGKLYRTTLAKNKNGEYLASNQLIACLDMLAVDCCLSPRGDLLAACHSGGPDWGTGPSGIGKLFLIRYSDRETPQPTKTWVAGPQEVRVAFDQPLEPRQLKNLAEQTKISYGEYVAAGDRFESIRPGYAVTQLQQDAPRYYLPVYSASITPDRRTLILATAAHPAALQYAMTLPGLGRGDEPSPDDVLPQHPQLDLAYSLQGVWATWEPADDLEAGWNGWLPHLDPTVIRALGNGDATQARFWEVIQQPGTLTVETQIDPRGLFYPAIQPGAALDYDRSEDDWIAEAAISFNCSRPFSLALAGAPYASSSSVPDGRHEISLPLQQASVDAPISIALKVETGRDPLLIVPSWKATMRDDATRSGPLALHRFLLPWAKIDAAELAPSGERSIPELAGANWGRGRRVFLSSEAGCANCHVAHQEGALIGPDLSNLVHRDYASVMRDITHPGFAINPDYITYSLVLRDGRVVTGTVSSKGDELLVGDKDGKVTAVPREDVEEMNPSPVSIMPEGISEKLQPEQLRDLLAFLLRVPPHMPLDPALPAPPSRRRSEVAAVLKGSQLAGKSSDSSEGTPSDFKPLNLLLVAGEKDHGPGEHDYPAWLRVWSELLSAAEGVNVDTAMEWPLSEQIRAADTIVFYQKGSWTADRAREMDGHLAKGGGLVYIHWAVEGGPEAPAFAQRIGLAGHAALTRFRHGPLELGFETGGNHPIARNFNQLKLHDESYWNLQGDASNIRIIASGVEEGESRPLFWTLEPGQGRVFVSIPGHYSWTFDDPLFRILLLRGIAWSANDSVDRFNDIALIGVKFAD